MTTIDRRDEPRRHKRAVAGGRNKVLCLKRREELDLNLPQELEEVPPTREGVSAYVLSDWSSNYGFVFIR